jgi:hypothetical protein
LRTYIPFEDLMNGSDEALKRLGYRFYRNRSLVEFEVFDPAEFLVRIEDPSQDSFRPEPFFGLMGGGGAANSFSLVASGPSESKRHVSTFVKELLSKLPREPWDGLGFIEKRTSKAYWQSLMCT